MLRALRALALLGLLIAGHAHALIPQQTIYYWTSDIDTASPKLRYADPVDACKRGMALQQAGDPANVYAYVGIRTPYTTAAVCDGKRGGTNIVYQASRGGGAGSCPANSTVSGTSCACTSPYVEDSTHTSCVAPLSDLQQFCQDNASRKNTFRQSGTVGLNSPLPSAACFKADPPFPGPDAVRGCAMTLGDGVAVPAPAEGLKHWSASGVMTGATCEDAVATDAAPKSADDPCPSGFPGTVNGETRCVAAEPDKGIEGVKGTSQTNADGTKVDTKETTKCLGTVCTTTTNTTTTTSGGAVTNSTSSRTESLGDKCAKDQKNDVCKKTQGGAGSATSDMTCDVNASAKGCGGGGADIGVLYAKKDKTVAQALVKAKDGLLASPVGASVGNFFSVSGGGSCTAVSAAIPFLNKTITIDTWCSTFALNMMAIVKTVLLMLASFMAFRVAIDY